jgi:hypothetical protein
LYYWAFNSYPLKTQKYGDYLLFKKAFNIINNKQYQPEIGLHKLISIRASLNKGLPERLQLAFPNVTPEIRPAVPKANLDPNNLDTNYWVSGFISGEGCFFIKTSKSKTHKLGISVSLNFLVVQDIRDAYLLGRKLAL